MPADMLISHDHNHPNWIISHDHNHANWISLILKLVCHGMVTILKGMHYTTSGV